MEGTDVVTAGKSPVLYQIADRKGESVVHHDRLKMCGDREFPVWLRKLRNRVLGQNDEVEQLEVDDAEGDMVINDLFGSGLGLASESLTPNLSDDSLQSPRREPVDWGVLSESLTPTQRPAREEMGVQKQVRGNTTIRSCMILPML